MNFEGVLDIIEHSTGVTIDTRTMSKGNVFFAISGDNFDGNQFVETALEKGAVLAISSNNNYRELKNVVVVEDVLETMQKLSRKYRDRFNIPILAITGTNGKTTTKELICTILEGKYKVLCTKGNFNNHIGVPLTLFGLNRNHDIGIVEMGASSTGEIKFLCEIANPNYGIITSIGKAHIEGFGSFENIIRTKLELFQYLKIQGGKFFYNKEVEAIDNRLDCDDCVDRFRSDNFHGNCFTGMEMKKTFPSISLDFYSVAGDIERVETNLYGAYNFSNIVNAVKIADYFDVDCITIQDKLKAYKPNNNRSQILNWDFNTIILDAYNANPTSMLEALKSFVGIDTEKEKCLVIGDMLELGEISLEEHKKVIGFIEKSKLFKHVIFVGNEFLKAKKDLKIKSTRFKFFNNSEEAKTGLISLGLSNTIILAKGSRGIKIETIFLKT